MNLLCLILETSSYQNHVHMAKAELVTAMFGCHRWNSSFCGAILISLANIHFFRDSEQMPYPYQGLKIASKIFLFRIGTHIPHKQCKSDLRVIQTRAMASKDAVPCPLGNAGMVGVRRRECGLSIRELCVLEDRGPPPEEP